MIEAAGASPGHSAPAGEPWANCPRPGAELRHTCAHLPASGGPTRPPRPRGNRVLRDGNVETALYCPTSALQWRGFRARKGTTPRDQRTRGGDRGNTSAVPGTVLNACHTLSLLVITMTFQSGHYHRFIGEENRGRVSYDLSRVPDQCSSNLNLCKNPRGDLAQMQILAQSLQHF